MFTLIHFALELIKISILGFIYAAILKFIYKRFNRSAPINPSKDWKPKFSSWFLISLGLFIFMFTHYGNHGLGDSARIPIGHGNDIRQIDETSYIDGFNIGAFNITNDFIYGYTYSDTFLKIKQSPYFAFDLKNNHSEEFNTKKDFISYLKTNNLDTVPDYRDFEYHYDKYWGGWRFLLLP